ncbi:tol-pal system YbgF family protein [Parabacteroides sp. Marseille-P3160]|uniref:tetratricopeptide repeat protein n=1 Tax=Parabacteroides sp. Marseille-P3160 TaxID=1917887 RepID=UPI0009BA0320|nr:tetratricopeptide repeat protein [Parabacteroides sp. Marseille-P3160]
MSSKQKSAGKELEVDVILSKSEQFIEKFKKPIFYGIVAVAVIIGAYLAFHYGYALPQNKKAEVALFKGEQYFARDSFKLALNGNGADYIGFEEIISSYRGTNAANLAKAYAGICYFRLGETDKAEDLLKSFSGNDKTISPAIVGLIGDCYVNSGKTEEGISYFKKAASRADNDIVSPIYLKKAGIAYESLKQYNEAIKAYTTIKEKYSASMEAGDIDKYISRAEIRSNTAN